MTRQELTDYFSETIENMTDEDFEHFQFPVENIDLYTFTEEFITIKNEIKKNNSVSLKITNNIQSLIEQTEAQSEKEKNENKIDTIVLQILMQIIKHNELVKRTKNAYLELPSPTVFNLKKYKQQLSAWNEGYNIQNEMWENLIAEIGLTKTGLAGETFDPNYHEAIEVLQKAGMKINQIIDTEEIGYLFQNKLIKRAKVTVNKAG